ncbi:MAG: alpha/beta hydrolase-fold protein [Vicinamibacterales bacterium]
MTIAGLTRRAALARLAVLVPQAAGAVALAQDLAPRSRPDVTARLRSAALGVEREYHVYLPEGYSTAPNRRYTTIYVLDGPPLDGHTADAARALAREGAAPGVIVIGIPNMRRGERALDFLPPSMSFPRRDGSRFVGGADRFLRFLADELVPRIDRDYRTAAPRLLVGHSLGAIFTCWSLVSAPALFQGRFAHSPAVWRDEDVVMDAVDRHLASAHALGGWFYTSVGANEGAGLQSGYVLLRSVLERRAAAAGLPWKAEITPGAAHETNVRLASPSALRAGFAALKLRP